MNRQQADLLADPPLQLPARELGNQNLVLKWGNCQRGKLFHEEEQSTGQFTDHR
jgi:hypothetical protein